MPWFPAVCARLCAHHFHLQLEGERIGYTVLFTDLALQVEQLMEVMTLTDDHRGGAGCAILFPGNEVQVRCMKVEEGMKLLVSSTQLIGMLTRPVGD
jgi:hypothetical protein